MFYSEKADFSGTYKPRLTRDRPTSKEGDHAVRIRNIRPLTQEHEGKTLDELQAIFAVAPDPAPTGEVRK